MDQFNISNQNAAYSNYASNVNASLAENASMQNQFDMNKAAGQTTHQSNQWDAAVGLAEAYTNEYNQARHDVRENQGLIDHGQALADITGHESMFTNSAVNQSGGMTGNGGITNPDWEYLTKNTGSDMMSVGPYADATDDATNNFTNSAPMSLSGGGASIMDGMGQGIELDFSSITDSINEGGGLDYLKGFQPPPTND